MYLDEIKYTFKNKKADLKLDHKTVHTLDSMLFCQYMKRRPY